MAEIKISKHCDQGEPDISLAEKYYNRQRWIIECPCGYTEVYLGSKSFAADSWNESMWKKNRGF